MGRLSSQIATPISENSGTARETDMGCCSIRGETNTQGSGLWMKNADMEYTDGAAEKNTAGNIKKINERARDGTGGITAMNTMVLSQMICGKEKGY